MTVISVSLSTSLPPLGDDSGWLDAAGAAGVEQVLDAPPDP